jgi:hypothetical protein
VLKWAVDHDLGERWYRWSVANDLRRIEGCEP